VARETIALLLLLQFSNGWRVVVRGRRRRGVRVWPEIIDGVRLNYSRRTVKLPGILRPLTIFRTLNRARRLSFNYSSCPRPRGRCSSDGGRDQWCRRGEGCRTKSCERLVCAYTPGAGSSDDRPSFVGRVVFFPPNSPRQRIPCYVVYRYSPRW